MSEIWDVIFEQEKAKNILSKMFEERRVPHAFLFSGPDGIGKYFTALQFAKMINSSPHNGTSDLILQKISSLQEPYVKLVIPLPRGKGEVSDDSATDKLSQDVIDSITDEIRKKIVNPYYKISLKNANTIKINSVREIRKYIITTTDEINYRFILIQDAHLMNETAQNAILKSIEEPPEGIIFVFITSDAERLLPTIKSRCWQLNFEPLSSDAVAVILVKHFGIEKTLAEKVALMSEGSPLIALELIDNQFELILEKTISILRFSLARKYHSAYKELSDFIRANSGQSIVTLSRMIKTWLNDVLKNRHSIFQYYFTDYVETLEKFNSKFHSADINRIFYSLDNLEKLQIKNANLNVVSLNLIFEIASLSIRN